MKQGASQHVKEGQDLALSMLHDFSQAFDQPFRPSCLLLELPPWNKVAGTLTPNCHMNLCNILR